MTSFSGLDLATLQTLKTAYVNALIALGNNQSYTLNGRSLTRANLNDIKEALGEVLAEIADANGTGTSQTVVNFTGVGGSY